MNITSDQVHAFLRHSYTVLGSALGTAVVFAPSKGDATTINEPVHKIGDGAASIAAGISMLIPVVSRLYAAWTASRTRRPEAMNADPQIVQVAT